MKGKNAKTKKRGASTTSTRNTGAYVHDDDEYDDEEETDRKSLVREVYPNEYDLNANANAPPSPTGTDSDHYYKYSGTSMLRSSGGSNAYGSCNGNARR